jgi:hypothetical protein
LRYGEAVPLPTVKSRPYRILPGLTVYVMTDNDRSAEVAEVEQRLSVRLPASVRGIYERSDGHWDEAGQWWVIWPLARLMETNQRAWGDGTLDRDLLAFGDDGTGNPFCVSLTSLMDEVLRWNLIDLAVEVHEGSMEQFCRTWTSSR